MPKIKKEQTSPKKREAFENEKLPFSFAKPG